MSWKRTYRTVWIANFATAAGMMSFLPFFPSHLESLGVEGRGAIAAWTGVVFGAAPLAAAFMSPIWGALGDRVGRRLMVLRSMLAITVFVGAMAFVRSPVELLVLRVLQGIFSGFLAPSMTLVSIAAPVHQQGRVSSSLQVAMSLGAIVGPLVGEFVRADYGIAPVYLSVAFLSGCSALLVLLFAHEDPAQRRAPEGPLRLGGLLRATFSDLGELRTNASLRGATVILFWVQFGNGATVPQLELLVRELDTHMDWVVPSTAALFSVPAAMNLVAMPLWGRRGDRSGHMRMLALCASLAGMLLLLHAFVVGYEDLFAARVLLGLAMAGVGPLAFGVAAAESTTDRRGSAIGAVFAARALAVAVSSMLGGVLVGLLGIDGLFLAGGASILLATWFARRGRLAAGAAGPDSAPRN